MNRKLRAAAFGFALAWYCAVPALADDTEIFVGGVARNDPNLLLIIDSSGSMTEDAEGERPPFDPTATYAGDCDRNTIYWRRDRGTDPICRQGDIPAITQQQLVCNVALQGIAQAGFVHVRGVAQWDDDADSWTDLAEDGDGVVECEQDGGVHGPDAGDGRTWPTQLTQWTNVEADRFRFNSGFTDRDYLFYSGNYLNWQDSAPAADPPSRMEVVKQAATTLVRNIINVNVGLMRYSANGGDGELAAEGGMVVHPVSPLTDTARADLLARIDEIQPAGFTPMSETLWEAHQYFAGATVQYGLDSRSSPGVPMRSVDSSRTGPNLEQYLSPATAECQQNFIIYLTDGLPTRDNSADEEIEGLAGACNGTGEGRCLDDLAGYMQENDQRPAPGPGGDQTINTYTVGFGQEVQGSTLLQETARRGNGAFFEANNSVQLTAAFNNIIARIDQTGSTFAAPTVTVNSFNRTETLSDLYIPVFEPGTNYHWAGNFKKYQFDDGVIVDANGRPAIGTNGFFDARARSLWSARVDGDVITLGGAANELPAPNARRLFTFLGAEDDLSATANAVVDGNGAITDAMLGLGQPDQPTRAELIDWARGADIRNVDGDPATTQRNQIGDPLHGRPALVVYGGTAADPDAVLFGPTNDGYLHAIDARTGDELWAFIPRELLSRLPALFVDDLDATKNYGLDSDIRAFRTDENNNGVVDGDDRVLLFFGMGRGGSNYYALDVTQRNSPRHLWTLGPTQLAGIAQTWAPPALTRIQVSGATQNELNLALVLSGGYDDTQDDDQTATLYNSDNIGNRIYIVDAFSGALLWMGGGPGARDDERNLTLPRMTNSIPAALRVIDLDGDSFGDRMYAADTGGRVWRFDIVIDSDTNQAGIQVPGAAGLITGGRFATLGAADPDAGTGNLQTRRFYNTPDVALIRRRGSDPFLSVSLGSGWRGHPLNEQIGDMFFSLRDYAPFTRFTQADYDNSEPIVIADLADVTTAVTQQVPEGASGWRLELRLPNGFEGEKVLAESRTFNNQVFFPTYLPQARNGSCAPVGRNRVYAVSVDNGAPLLDLNNDNQTTPTDRYTDLAQGGIAPEVTFLFPRQVPGQGPNPNDPNDPNNRTRPILCAVGLEVLAGLCTDQGTPVRTFWRQN